MIHNPNKLNLSREVELKQQISGGLKVSDNAFPYLKTRGFYGIMADIAQRKLPEEAKATATLMLSMGNVLDSIRGRSSDASIHSAMHAAMGELIDSAYDTNITKTALVGACMRFSKNNDLLSSGDEIEKLENEIMTNLTSVWHEHCWENLFLAAGINVERANRGDDLGGTDLWVELPDGSWVSVDVKTQPQTVHNYAQRKGVNVFDDYYYDCDGVADHGFSLYSAVSTEKRSAYVAFQNPPSSGGLAPIDFRQQPNATENAKVLVDMLTTYAHKGLIKRYAMVETENGVSFIPESRKVKR